MTASLFPGFDSCSVGSTVLSSSWRCVSKFLHGQMGWGKATETSKAGSLCRWPFASSDPLVSILGYLA